MLALIGLLIQAGPSLPPPVTLGLERLRAEPGCAVPDTDDVVVCARRPDRDRLGQLFEPPAEEGIGRAEFGIGRLRGAAELEQREFPGASSQRLMMWLKLPF